MNATPFKFTPGQILHTRSACDWDCIYSGEVLAITAQRVKIDLGNGEVVTVKIFRDDDGNERCYPHGRYSMAASFHASSASVAVGESIHARKGTPVPAAAPQPELFPTVEVQAEVRPQGEAIPQAPANIINAFPSIGEKQNQAKLSAILATFETAQLIEELCSRGNEGLLAIRDYIMKQANR